MNLQARIRKLESQTQTAGMDPNELVELVVYSDTETVRQTMRLGDLPSVDGDTIRIEVAK